MPAHDAIEYDEPLFALSETLRRRLPEDLDELVEAELRLIKANVLAERWDAAHRAIDRLAAEAIHCRPWRILLAERLALSVQLIGLSVRTANMLEARGFDSVEQLLRATRAQVVGLEQIGPSAIEECKAALTSLFRREIKIGGVPWVRELVWNWPAGESTDAA